MNQQRIIVGISGASGAIYAQRTVRLLLSLGIDTHLVVTPLGQRLLHDELGHEGLDLEALTGVEMTGRSVPGLTLHNYRDVGATIASGSFKHDGMLIVPCSSNSLACVATGSQQNLLHRAAAVTLKERRKLVLVHRETPLSLVEIRNMERATEAGAIIMPASPGFYLLPDSIDQLVDFIVARALDLLEIDHGLNIRWGEADSRQSSVVSDQ